MSSVFNKNSILTGCVDYFCLACESQLRSDEDAIQHIGKPIHKKNLDATSFLDKHKDDRVRKIKKGYYCEFCNVFMRTAAKVGPHVAEPAHRENKSARPLSRQGNGVLAFDNVFINENAWHGLIDDTCAVCDAEFDNAQIHKTDTWHALNLVLVEIEIGPDNNVYRKVDESTFQCLTCNMVCAQNTMAEHFEDAEHKKLYQQCCVSAKTNNNQKQNGTETAKNELANKSSEKEVKEEKAQKTAEKETIKDEKSSKSPENESPKKKSKQSPEKESKEEATKTEVEKKSGEAKEYEKKDTKTAEVAKQEVKKSGKGGKDALGKTDRDICKGLGAVNYITRDVCGKQWCILCDWAMDDSAVKSHIESRHHQTLLKMHKERQAQNQNGELENGEDLNENMSRISDSASEFQKNDIKLDLIDSGAYCRKCSKNIDFDFDVIKDHIEEHKKKPAKEAKEVKEVKPFPTGSETKSSTNLFTTPVHKNDPKPKQEKRESRASSVDSNRELDEIDAFAKQHNLTYNIGNSNVFCRLCVTKIPACLKNMREHVNGTGHKSKIAKTTVKSTVNAPTMTPSHVFIDNVITVENMFSKDIVINEKYVVNILSFLMITKNGATLRCQACEVNVAMSEIDKHKNTPKHERTMNEAMVASSEDSEFIREIRPNLFHCGFCNQLEATWATMNAHLKSTAHRQAKTSASWRMQEYVPMIAQHRMRQRMQLDFFTRMLVGQMFGDD
ncbi:uncharacterized protein LOC133529642 [Cydia pomonella]|uniref:uncharacterized protein LOC133529642 n=1 Tax=Cydia pomonella TaxID=82600 RepID=UPI002ADD49BC|nr:uncharacterized protein LOC133529642 [Cydia pomonella]XP_061723388.1 uncharacterized protein LOC133529642 [Cydia pomonella]XP_061723389.1 uncharacterized protein LOC133529642 [Cydia pomonella]